MGRVYVQFEMSQALSAFSGAATAPSLTIRLVVATCRYQAGYLSLGPLRIIDECEKSGLFLYSAVIRQTGELSRVTRSP
jgi:hypothetical protein